jgi:putative hydrolase of the HAD superfamily
MVRTIIFDLGKVLISFDFSRGYQTLEELARIPAADIRKRIAATDLVHRFESGHVEPRDFVDQLCGMLSLSIEYDHFCRIWSSIFLPEPLLPEDLLEALHRNYRLLLLSNTNAIHFDMIRETYPLVRHFDHYILSHEVKAMKPDPRIYRAALAEARCAPGECFYTDDIADYVEGARREGIDAIQFQSRGQLEQEMKARGIVW